MKNELLPIATVLTPNIPEAETITGMKIETAEEIRKRQQRFCNLVLIVL